MNISMNISEVKAVASLVEFLRTTPAFVKMIINNLHSHMKELASNEQYEAASKIRDLLNSLRESFIVEER